MFNIRILYLLWLSLNHMFYKSTCLNKRPMKRKIHPKFFLFIMLLKLSFASSLISSSFFFLFFYPLFFVHGRSNSSDIVNILICGYCDFFTSCSTSDTTCNNSNRSTYQNIPQHIDGTSTWRAYLIVMSSN